jgi:hypothetical protein
MRVGVRVMVASRSRVIGACYPARFWLSAFCAALMPTSIGYQDLAALIAHRPGVSTAWNEHLIASPFGTIEAATFNYTRPIGTAMPEPVGFQTVSFDPGSLDAFAWKIDEPLSARPARQIDYPSVDRRHKGDRLPAGNPLPQPSAPASVPQLQPISAPAAAPMSPPPQPTASAPMPRPTAAQQQPDLASPSVAHMDAPAVAGAAPAAPIAAITAAAPLRVALTEDDDDAALDRPPEIPAAAEADATDTTSSLGEMSFLDGSPSDGSVAVYFGDGVMGAREGLEDWAPGAAPILASPSGDSDIKLSALDDAAPDTGAGETVAGKDDPRLMESPAQHLALDGRPRARAEKCLADAVYFEARGEPLKGQEAVAQVVMNRVFSGYYPHDVCGVVYQNSSRHLACQFTFACEGRNLSRIEEPDMWEQAKRIAKDTLDGKIWLTDIGHATHYHAYWVHPSWVHEMTRLYKLGVHTFYRPRAWGDGDDAPVWGTGPNTSKADSPPGDPQAAASTPPVTEKPAATAKL